MPNHITTQISTQKLNINKIQYIGFKLNDVYNNKHLFKNINCSITIKGLIYFQLKSLPKSILNSI
jgi:hypothetical protein